MKDKSHHKQGCRDLILSDPVLEEFLEKIYGPYSKYLMAYFKKRSNAPTQDLEDLTHSTWHGFLEALIKEKVDLGRWERFLWGIAKHKLIDYMKVKDHSPLDEED